MDKTSELKPAVRRTNPLSLVAKCSTAPTTRTDDSESPSHYHPSVDLDFVRSRQRLLSSLIKLSSALEQGHWDLSETLLNQFCDLLVSYLNLGYQRAFALDAPDPHLYAAIASTTRTSLAFHDRFCRGTGSLVLVRNALEQLALALETRFELEDDLQAQAA